MLADDDPIGADVDIDWTTDCSGPYEVFVVVEPHDAGLRHRCLLCMKPVEATEIGDELGPLLLEDLPYGLFGARASGQCTYP